MFDAISEIKAAATVVKVVRGPLSQAILRLRVFINELIYRSRPPLTEQQASDIAFQVLHGHIVKAVPYRNLGTKHKFIAVFRSASEADSGGRVHVLEEFAGNYREIFASGQLWRRDAVVNKFSVEDLDRDGKKEIIFASSSCGSAGGSDTLSLYVPARRGLYTFTVEYQWSSPNEPSTRIIVQPDPLDDTDQKWLGALERKVRALRFLEPVPRIDLDDPRNAVLRWHKENGSLEFGPVRLHYYEGQPICVASITARINDGDITWTAYFKSAVYGYDGMRNKHFVLYSPSYSYSWPTCLVADAKFLWIGTRGNGIVRYDKRATQLKKIVLTFEGKEVLEVESIRVVNSYFEVNGKVLFDGSTLRR